jgi:Spy/CpxP family protein refolding chaperone
MLNKLVLSVIFVSANFAQPPAMGPGQGPGQPPVTEIKAYLNLSDTQITSITNAIRTSADANRTLAEQMRTKHQMLQTALNNGSIDAAAIGRAMLEIQALRKQLEANHTKAREQAVSFLSTDQKAKLKTLEDAEKLREEIGEAHALNLLAPPAGGAGPVGFGPQGPLPRGFGISR